MGDAAGTAMERFRPLHELAQRVVQRLGAEYDVDVSDASGLDRELEREGVVGPTILLKPKDEESAPLVVAFTDVPGLNVRFGRTVTRGFPPTAPSSESLEEESERFLWRVLQLVEGRYRESTRPGPGGSLVVEHEFWSPDGARAGGSCRFDLQSPLSRGMEAVIQWQPWRRRTREPERT